MSSPVPAKTSRKGLSKAQSAPDVRQIYRRAPYKRIGIVFSDANLNAGTPWESINEQGAIRLLQQTPGVHSVRPFQRKVIFTDNEGQERYAYPDLDVLTTAGRGLIEVADDDSFDKPEERALLGALRRHLELRDVPYRVLLKSVINQEPRLANVEALRRYRFVEVDPGVAAAAKRVVSRNERMAITDLMEAVPGLTKLEVYGLIANRELHINHTVLLHLSMVSTIGETDDGAFFDRPWLINPQ